MSGKIDDEGRIVIGKLHAMGRSHAEIARQLGVTEGAVRYHLRRQARGHGDGRKDAQHPVASDYHEYIADWVARHSCGLNLAALHEELVSEFGIRMKLIQIPREIMEKNRTSPPPFLEMAVLEAEPVYRTEGGKRMVDIKLTRFMPSLAEVPTKELEALKERAVKSGFDFIDFWAVDFDWHPEIPFNHHWQDYRTRKDRSLKTVSDAGHVYEKPGTYTACVKVVDVFGADTSITVEVEV